jgi:hypothetical protein
LECDSSSRAPALKEQIPISNLSTTPTKKKKQNLFSVMKQIDGILGTELGSVEVS